MSDLLVHLSDQVGMATVTTICLTTGTFFTEISYDTPNADFRQHWPTREAAVAGHQRVVAAVHDRGYATGPETCSCPRCGIDAYYGTAEFGHCGACHYLGTQPDDEGD